MPPFNRFAPERRIAPLLAGALLLGIAACSGLREPPKAPDPNVAPANFKAKILTEMQARLSDPTEVRDTAVSEPTLRQTGTVQRYISCLRYNAKDESGKYSGITERAVYFYDGEITQVIEDSNKDLCRGVSYQPFPEMGRMCREVVCPAKR
jgi:hypothetical protein